jgi:hypothetical protein
MLILTVLPVLAFRSTPTIVEIRGGSIGICAFQISFAAYSLATVEQYEAWAILYMSGSSLRDRFVCGLFLPCGRIGCS